MNTDSNLTNLFTESVKPKLFMDFDGTISEVDVIDAILEKFADSRWLETENEWIEGKIGSRECLRKQFSYVQASSEQLFEFVDTLNIDEGFQSVLNFCREMDLNVHIISDGFEEYIGRMLDRYLTDPFEMERITVSANSLISLGENQWATTFPHFDEVCVDGCATCKPAVMQLHNPFSANTIFVGDGMSDRFAAQSANFIFAKSKLAEYCYQNSITHTSYRSLNEVAESLEKAFESGTIMLPAHVLSWSEAV